MCKKLVYLAFVVLVLGLAGDVQAARGPFVRWTDAGPDDLWSTPSNWDIGIVPTPAEEAVVDILPGPTIAKEGAKAMRVWSGMGTGATGAVTVDGGTLALDVSLTLGSASDSKGTLNMNSGAITVAHLKVGNGGLGVLNMTGGTIDVTSFLRIPAEGAGTGHLTLNGGVITAANLKMAEQPGSVGTLDVGAGTLRVHGDNISTIQGYIDNGWITAFDGNGRLQLDYDVANGDTTLKAIPFLLNPNPKDASTVSVSLDQLQWTLPEPNLPGGVVTCDVYFGTDGAVTKNPKVVDHQAVESVSVTLSPLTTYYWAIDVYDSSVSATDPVYLSPMFTFDTMNQAPIVDAGVDVVTWLEEGVGRNGNLDATVTDEGLVSPYTVQWSVVSEPNEGAAVIETPDAEDTSITLAAVGRYVLQLEAFDGEYTVSDTVVVGVYNDRCEAAKSVPNYQPLVGDINGDCRVDSVDMDLLQDNWLEDNSLTEDWVLLN